MNEQSNQPALTLPADYVDEAGCVHVDAYCSKCGYNLKRLSREARCPECGRAVEDSIGRPFALSSPEWRKRVVRGSLLMAFGAICRVLFFLPMLFMADILPDQRLAWVVIVLLGGSWLTLGIFMFTSRDAAGANRESLRLSVIARLAAIVELGVLVALPQVSYAAADDLNPPLITLWAIAVIACMIAVSKMLADRYRRMVPEMGKSIYIPMWIFLLFPCGVWLGFFMDDYTIAGLLTLAGLVGLQLYCLALLIFYAQMVSKKPPASTGESPSQ